MHQVCILCRFIALQYEQSSVALCLPEFAADVYDDALESAFFTDSLPCSVTELCGSFSSGGALDRWSEIVFYDFRSGLLNFECASFRDVSSPCTICQSSCPDYVHAYGDHQIGRLNLSSFWTVDPRVPVPSFSALCSLSAISQWGIQLCFCSNEKNFVRRWSLIRDLLH